MRATSVFSFTCELPLIDFCGLPAHATACITYAYATGVADGRYAAAGMAAGEWTPSHSPAKRRSTACSTSGCPRCTAGVARNGDCRRSVVADALRNRDVEVDAMPEASWFMKH
jgi:hypothetical protein